MKADLPPYSEADESAAPEQAWKFDSAGSYFSSHQSESWRCIRCSHILASPADGRPPVTCLVDLGGCGRSRGDDDEAFTYFVPSDWSEERVRIAIDAYVQPGPRIFNEVEGNLRRHFYLKENWQYRIVALYVLQCKVAIGLPAVFYIGLGGTRGSGKTALQAHVARLAKGHVYSNMSIAVFARRMKHGDSVCVDEIDESHGTEYDNIRNALLRDGYRANGPKYERWDYKRNVGEAFSVYGPKMFGYRGGLEDALYSRALPIPSVKPVGAAGAEFVMANLWPEDDGLPSRLDDWGKEVIARWPPVDLKALAASEAFRSKLLRAVKTFGANRETELSTIALLVGEMAGVDIGADLKAANEAAATVPDPEVLEQLRGIVRALLRDSRPPLDGTFRFRQSVIRQELNNLRLVAKQRPVTDAELAKRRRDLGVDDNLIIRPGNKTTWCIPTTLADEIRASEGEGDDVSHGGRANP